MDGTMRVFINAFDFEPSVMVGGWLIGNARRSVKIQLLSPSLRNFEFGYLNVLDS
jgi:hypothetical protein